MLKRFIMCFSVSWLCLVTLPGSSFSAVTPHPLVLYTQGKNILDAYRGEAEDLKAAEKIFQTLIRRYPDSALGYLGMSRVKIYDGYYFGNEYNMNVIHDEAMPYAVRALELGPTLQEVHENFTFLEKIFEQYYSQKKETQILLSLQPEDPETFFQFGLFLFEQNEMKEAGEYFETALTMRPPNELRFRLLKRLGWLNLFYLQDTEKAVGFYNAALEIRESNDVNQYLGLAYLKRGRYDLAISRFSRLTGIVGQQQARYHLLLAKGRDMLEKGDSEATIKYLEQAERIRALDSETHFTLGSLYFGRNDYERAYQHFRQVIELCPDEARAYYFAGRAVHSLGKPAVAVLLFSKYLRLGADEQNAEWIREHIPDLTQNTEIETIK